MGKITINPPKSKWPIRATFAVAAAGLVAGATWFLKDDYESVRLLTPEEGHEIMRRDPSRTPPPKNWEDTFLREKVPGEERAGTASNAWIEAAKPHDETKEDDTARKQEALKIAKHYYEWFLSLSDPIDRSDRLKTVKEYADRYPEILESLGMTRERFDGLYKSVIAQAAPPLLDRIRNYPQYERNKIGDIMNLREIATNLSNGNRARYYESMGASQPELQGHYCDGAVAEGRLFLSRVKAVFPKQKITETEARSFSDHIGLLDTQLPVYFEICKPVGRNSYAEIGVSLDGIRGIYESYKPEIIPDPKPQPN